MTGNRPIGTAGVPLFKPTPEPKSRRRQGLKTKTPLRASNPERKAKAYERNFSGPVGGQPGHDELIRSLPSAATGQRRSDMEAAHVIRRKWGGVNGTFRDLIPLERPLHVEMDRIGPDAFGQKYGFNPRGLRHALVIGDPSLTRDEHHAAWLRLVEEVPDQDRGRVLQHAWDLLGFEGEVPLRLEDILALEAAS